MASLFAQNFHKHAMVAASSSFKSNFLGLAFKVPPYVCSNQDLKIIMELMLVPDEGPWRRRSKQLPMGADQLGWKKGEK